MVTEYIRYVIPTERAAEFHDAYRRASAALDASPECLGYELTRGIQEMKHYEVTDVAAER